ncbi:autophagy 2 [Forsythia ovata]|uniref:Autophagy-related protein 2 n=1 Tax=Forsythia ovata TaxID=205694 RepID=A0ABD1P0V8_9LAMI
MFTWSIAKSAEAMFSRWAIKRLCKFLLKKKLGKFILGDIDLNQLDVQLSAGTIQLSDLAINVDYINQKFNAATVFVKEGSIGSLMVTMPWKDGGCQIEVDELEIVLTPRRGKLFQDESKTSSSCENHKNNFSHHFRKLENDAVNGGLTNASVDVHEGVKTIAKMVKWLLTSFHVKVKKLIVAFDPFPGEEKKEGLCRTVVLRITEAECGTQISEDASPSSENTVHNFLGLSQLTNFVKFQGAVIELLHTDDVDHQRPPQRSPATPFGDWFSGNHSSGSVTSIITGEKGGFSGNLKLSIPWKNGSLDVHKVDADVHIDPLVLRVQPSTLRYFISIWNLFKGMGAESEGHSGASSSHSSNLDSRVLAFDMGPLGNEGFVTGCSPPTEKESATYALLSESHFISDWASKNQKDRTEEEPDFGASMDQFFECVDELRNSQSALGNSGVWNWTCSVFSAITAASNLASGSLHVPSEQQHVETNFKATIDKISVLFSFTDEDQKDSLNAKDAQANADFRFHYLYAKFTDLFFIFQVCPRETNFEATVHHIELVDHFLSMNDSMDLKFHGHNGNSESQMVLIQQMQNGVQSALLNFSASSKDALDHPYDWAADFLPNIQNMDGCCNVANGKVVSVTLLKTSDVGQVQVTMNSLSSDNPHMGPTSFSLKLPRFVIWVNFGLLSMLSNFMKEMENCIGTTSTGNTYASELQTNKYLGESTKESLRGNIFLQDARIILCFPIKEGEYFRSYISCNQFIAIDFYSPKLRKEVRAAKPMPASISKKRYVVAASRSLHLNFPDLHVYFITSASKKNVECGFCSGHEPSFSVEKIISIAHGTGCQSVISMFWQESINSAPWMAKKAKLFADNTKREDKFVGRDREFASVTTVKDTADFDTYTQPEIISSSGFILRAHLSPVTINLAKSHYENLHDLAHQVIDCFSCTVSDPGGTNKELPLSQTSILVECDSVTISVTAEVGDVKPSIQYELPGSWHSFSLQVHRFELLSVTNIGGIRSASFLRVSHGQGNLWGSITEGLPREFLLISCSDSTMGRGDGEGSNVLSSSHSGSDIVHFWDPESTENYTSTTVRCATIVAVGGRLDWLNTIVSFFILPSSGLEQADDNSLRQIRGSSFLLNLVDIGLSYEPYLKKLQAEDDSDHISSPQNINDVMPEQYVACLLAASSLKLSNRTVVDCTAAEYKIRLQDLGLLLCSLSESKVVGNTYSAEHLSKIGYVKVAQEAHVEALVRTNYQNSHMWEVECTQSHIVLNTCHDTASGLIRLADQLQKLFAPDMQESIAHLQTRWNNFQQVHESKDGRTLSDNFSPPVSDKWAPIVDTQNKPGLVNLLDEICEDVFHLDGNCDGQAKFFESRVRAVVTDSSLGEQCNLTVRDSQCFSDSLPLAGSVPVAGLEASGAPLHDNSPEFIEEYFLSDLRPLSELTLKSQPPNVNLKCKTGSKEDPQTGNGGWYGETSLRILDNHVSKVNEQTNVLQLVEGESSSSDTEYDDCRKVVGCVLLKNMNINWRMYAGSDWFNSESTVQQYANYNGRDTTISFELVLSAIGFQYDVFPDGGIWASRFSLSIQDCCLTDNSHNAPWKQVLGHYQSKKYPRKSSSKALKLDMEAVRPDPSIPLEENRLRVALLPLRLHLHQNQLDFLISFFGGKSSSADLSQSDTSPGPSESGKSPKKSANLVSNTVSDEAFLTYFQKFDIQPVLIRVDYSPHHVDLAALRGGKYVELVNIVPWKGVELQLKHVQAVGVYGWGSVCETIVGDWLEDISQNQVHKLLKGLPPIRSLVAVGSGAAKLVTLPVKSYRKDHRLLKGMQRGTIAFLRSISLEAIGLGVHLAAGAHDILLQAEYILTSIPPSVPWPSENRITTNVRSNQPNDARQGIQQAFESISDGLGKSASALVQTPLKKYQRGAGVGSALATAVQAAPAAAIAPAAAAARAAHCALLGFRNSLDPERKRESLEKYLGRTQPQEFKQ